MKTVTEIKSRINFPKVKDAFGSEIIPGDVIGMTLTSTKHIYIYLVTEKFTTGNRVILIDVEHDSHSRGYLDLTELNNNKHWYKTNVIKLNTCLPDHIKATVEQLKAKFIQDNKNREQQIINNRKSAIQARYFPVFYKNKNTKQFGVIFTFVESQPGKVISKAELIKTKNELIKNNSNCILNLIDIDGALTTIDNMKAKPELFSIDRSYYWTKPSGIKFNLHCVNNDIWFHELKQKEKRNKVFNIQIPIYSKTENSNIPNLHQNYKTEIGIDNFGYSIQVIQENKTYIRPLADVFSTEAINKFNTFHNYYA